jgi:DNA-binding LacI/PurR family transcriptional regulator
MTAKKNVPDADRPATLKMLAEYLDLLPATVSIVLNNLPVASSIPAATKQARSRRRKKIRLPPQAARPHVALPRHPHHRHHRTRQFTALFCFNDTSAIGAIRALQDAGLTCPHDISVIGFDDIIVAEYFNPRLTTVRQPLYKMGSAAAELLVKRTLSPDQPYLPRRLFEPELIVRESTIGNHKSSRPGPLRGKR